MTHAYDSAAVGLMLEARGNAMSPMHEHNENDPQPKAPPVTPGGPTATPDTPEGRAAAAEEGEEA